MMGLVLGLRGRRAMLRKRCEFEGSIDVGGLTFTGFGPD